VCRLFSGLSSNEFFLLHGVTSFFALRHILPVLSSADDRVRALRYTLKMVLAVYLVQKMPEHDSPILAQGR
jgi:hypothetical protein